MKKKFPFDFGVVPCYRLEYLKHGGDYVTIDSVSKKRMVKKFYFLSNLPFVRAMRLVEIKDGCLFPLLTLVNNEVHKDKSISF